MQFKEFQALLLLYQAAPPELRERAARFVPELTEWDVAQPAPIAAPPDPRVSYDRDVPPPFGCEHPDGSTGWCCGGFWKRSTPDDPTNPSYFWVKICTDTACPLNQPTRDA